MNDKEKNTEEIQVEVSAQDNEAEAEELQPSEDSGDMEDMNESQEASITEEAVNRIEELEKRLETAETKVKEEQDRFLRVAAEFDNYKKRSTREMERYRKFAVETLVNDLLPVVDSMERAMEVPVEAQSDGACILDGVRLTHDALLKVLQKYGVEPIESLGEVFDPNYHEAVMQEQTPDMEPNRVCKEYRKGYVMHDRLLRPAQVVVSIK